MIGAPSFTFYFTLFATAMALLSTTERVAADDTFCSGSFGAVTLDNVIIPDGATCTLTSTTVQGNIKVGTGSTLLGNVISVIGSVQAESSKYVLLTPGSTVNGDVEVKKGGGGPRSARLVLVTIGGKVLFEECTSHVRAEKCTVTGDIQVFKNTGGAVVTRNTVNGNIQCKENVPAPTGVLNVAASKEDQCAAL
jgi:hypothetical protein